MWMRLTLTVNRAAILKRRKRIWPIEATASSVPFKTLACRVLMIRCAKAENQSRSWLEAIQWVTRRVHLGQTPCQQRRRPATPHRFVAENVACPAPGPSHYWCLHEGSLTAGYSQRQLVIATVSGESPCLPTYQGEDDLQRIRVFPYPRTPQQSPPTETTG